MVKGEKHIQAVNFRFISVGHPIAVDTIATLPGRLPALPHREEETYRMGSLLTAEIFFLEDRILVIVEPFAADREVFPAGALAQKT
jgi:hypothetical protein